MQSFRDASYDVGLPTYSDTQPLSDQADVRQRRVLQTIIAEGSAEPPNLLFNPAWSKNRKIACVACGIFGLLIFLVLFIAMVVGFVTALLYVQERDRIKKIGLFMIPNVVDDSDDGLLRYGGVTDISDPEKKKIIDGYVADIENFLQPYYIANSSAKQCSMLESSQERCRFDLTTLGGNCTKEEKFGYYSGNPCFILGIRNIQHWTPLIDEDFIRQAKYNLPDYRRDKLDVDHMPVYCSPWFHWSMMNVERSQDPMAYFPNVGMQIIFLKKNSTGNQLPPLVFVQMKNVTKDTFKRVECKILAKNLDSLVGVKQISFGTSPNKIDDYV